MPFTLLATTLACSLFAIPAQAQRARVFVSVNGNDANPCTGGSPCKTFQHAHDVVLPGGEISVLDTGGYGIITITKAISIVAVGVEAGIAIPAGFTGITIDAADTDKVSLRGLTLDGQGVAASGIVFNSGGSLTVENCVVRNFASSGIGIGSNKSSKVFIANTLVADNGGHGIYVQPTGQNESDVVWVVFNRVEVFNNALRGIGIFGNQTSGQANAKVIDSVSANNLTGIYALGNNAFLGYNAYLQVFRSSTFGNGNFDGNGIFADTNGQISVAESHVEDDGWGHASGGILVTLLSSYGDNYTNGNSPPDLLTVNKK
jgi:hypothetical protein